MFEESNINLCYVFDGSNGSFWQADEGIGPSFVQRITFAAECLRMLCDLSSPIAEIGPD